MPLFAILILLLLFGSFAGLVAAGVWIILKSRNTGLRSIGAVIALTGIAFIATFVLVGFLHFLRPPVWSWLGLELLISLGVIAWIFWVWMLADCALNETTEGTEKLVWVIIIMFAPLVGSLIYYFARRPRRIAELDR